MNDPALLELRHLRDEVAEVRRLLARLVPDALTPAQRAVVEALEKVYGSSPFTTAEACAVCQHDIGSRPALKAALLGLVGAVVPQRVGIALARIVELGGEAGDLRLTAPRRERGRALWCVDRSARGCS